MDLQTALNNRGAACVVIAMLAPYGLSLPYVLSATRAEGKAGADVLVLDGPVRVHGGGTVIFEQGTMRVALADTSEQGKRPFYRVLVARL